MRKIIESNTDVLPTTECKHDPECQDRSVGWGSPNGASVTCVKRFYRCKHCHKSLTEEEALAHFRKLRNGE